MQWSSARDVRAPYLNHQRRNPRAFRSKGRLDWCARTPCPEARSGLLAAIRRRPNAGCRRPPRPGRARPRRSCGRLSAMRSLRPAVLRRASEGIRAPRGPLGPLAWGSGCAGPSIDAALVAAPAPGRRSAQAPRIAGARGPARRCQYGPRPDAALSLLTVLMLWQITLSPISRRCAIPFMDRGAFPYLLLMALNTDSTVDRAW